MALCCSKGSLKQCDHLKKLYRTTCFHPLNQLLDGPTNTLKDRVEFKNANFKDATDLAMYAMCVFHIIPAKRMFLGSHV